jgi:putative endonuclease
MVAAHIEYGRRGEERAASWYLARGYEIVCRNWRCAVGEIDLIVRRGRVLVVCEVKARRSDAFGMPALAVGAAKQQRLRRLAAAWLASNRRGRRVEVRFDVVAVTGDDVHVYESAF